MRRYHVTLTAPNGDELLWYIEAQNKAEAEAEARERAWDEFNTDVGEIKVYALMSEKRQRAYEDGLL